MHKELASPLRSLAASQAVSPWLRNIAIVVLGTAFVAACSHLAIPLWFTPVPLTMQPFAVLLLALILTPGLAAATLCAYLIEGALGLPVFAPGFGFGAGMAHLLGPTGGYLWSYPAAAALASYVFRSNSRGFAAAITSATLGNLVILFCGFVWIAAYAHASAAAAFTLAVLPFLPGDALKVIAVASIAIGLQRMRHRKA
jgi:biotin transport system substrate-specific component